MLPLQRNTQTGPIVGGVLGGLIALIVVLIMVVVVVLIMRSRKRLGKDLQGKCPYPTDALKKISSGVD